VPALVQRYLERVLPPGGDVPRQVRITQAGEMWRKPGARPLPFTAVQELAVNEVAFSWRARFPIVPLVWLDVVDRYADGEGMLEARALGRVRVMRQDGPEISRGEAMRYLAELAWVPYAMLANRRLEWRELDEQTVDVATRVGPARPAVQLHFDTAGDLVAARCDARPRGEGKTSVPTPWAGSFSDFAVHTGVRLPTRGEARWELPDGPFTYWRGTITSVDLVGRHATVHES